MEFDKFPRSYIFIWLASVLVAFVPLLWDERRLLYLTFLPAIISLIILIISDQVTGLKHRKTLREEVFSAITRGQVVTSLTSQQAREYVAGNARRAKTIYNTRFGNREKEDNNKSYLAWRRVQDDAVKQAVQHGVTYQLVYDKSHRDDIDVFMNAIDFTRHGVGQVHLQPVTIDGKPYLQFTILEYADHSECLLGFFLGDSIPDERDIYLIRSDRLCDYLRQVHQTYRMTLAA